MAKKQTRRGTSISRKLYERLKLFAAEHKIPAAQLVEQGVRAILDGRLPLEVPISYAAPRVRRAPVSRVVVPPRTTYPAATCAACVGHIPAGHEKPITVPWGRNDAAVRICEGCFAGGQAAAL